jgi:hypothetical protein
VFASDASGEGRVSYATVVRIGDDFGSLLGPGAEPLIATKTSGETVVVDSTGGTPTEGTPEPSRSMGGLVATEAGGNVLVNGFVVAPGSLPTIHGTVLDYVDPDGATVRRIGLLFAKPSKLFVAQSRIMSLDANRNGALVFTDDQAGLWRWDGPENVAGPVKMADGYIAASW